MMEREIESDRSVDVDFTPKPKAPPIDMTAHQPWFEETAETDKAEAVDEIDPWDDDDQETSIADTDEQPAPRTAFVRIPVRTSLARMLVVPSIIAITAGALVGYLAFGDRGGDAARPAAKVESPAVAPTPSSPAEPKLTTAEPAAAPPAVAKASLIDIRIDSKPAGATVTLVDRGKLTPLGTTPIATAVDPARTYELVFSHASKSTHIEKLDPSVTTRVDVTLDKRADSKRKKRRAGKRTKPQAQAAKPQGQLATPDW